MTDNATVKKGNVVRESAPRHDSKGGTRKNRNYTNFVLTLREDRVLTALRLAPRMREDIDLIAGASNGPAVIQALREMGFGIACCRIPKLDRDGRRCNPGQYRLISEPEA